MFLYQKLIDRSTLRQGFQIPVEFHHLLKAMPGGYALVWGDAKREGGDRKPIGSNEL